MIAVSQGVSFDTYEPLGNFVPMSPTSAACHLIVYPDVCSPLGSWLPYKRPRPRGAPERPSANQWSKHWKPLILIQSTGLQCWLSTVQLRVQSWHHKIINWLWIMIAISQGVSFDTYEPLGNFVPMSPISLFVLCPLSRASWNLCCIRSWSITKAK